LILIQVRKSCWCGVPERAWLSYARLWLATCALALVSASFAAESWIIEGRVIAVADGDTITILDRDKRQHKIRLNGIDAPEKGQPSGFRSKENLSKLVFDRSVPAECHKVDRYNREICKVLDGSVDVCLEQIRASYAWWYRAYAKKQSPEDRERYELAEQEAKAKKVGLWRDPNPVPPWEWRRRSGCACAFVELPMRQSGIAPNSGGDVEERGLVQAPRVLRCCFVKNSFRCARKPPVAAAHSSPRSG
jgi:endonuclease YncB( thermonuclease family)